MLCLLQAILEEEEAINEPITAEVTLKIPTPFEDNMQLNSM